MSNGNPTPREIFQEVLNRMSAGRLEETGELYAEDFTLSLPFMLPEPVEVHGKAEHRALMDATLAETGGKPPRMYDNLEVRDLLIHETTNPDVVIAEWTYVSRVGDTTIVDPNIVVMECRDGKVVRSRDYHNHVNRARADGTIPSQIAILESMILPEDKH